MSSNTQAAATTPSVANGNNVNYIASFAKSGNDPNAFDDGIHGSYHNAYVKTTSNVGGGFNEPYRLSMSSSNFSVVDFTHSYWHIRILQEIDFTNNVQFLMTANSATIGASDTTYTDNGLTWDTLRKALDDHTTATGAAETTMVFDYTQSSSTTNTCRDAIQMKGKTGTATAGTEFSGGNDPAYKVNSALAKAQYVFVGWKGSNQFIDDYVFLFNNMPAGESRQIFALTEGYVYNNMKSKTETCNKRNVDTTYKEAHEFNNSCCGAFISLYDIITGAIYNENGVRIGDAFSETAAYKGTAGIVKVPFDIIIPFDNLLSTQGFQIYPNKLFGDFGIQFRFTSAGMVHTQVKPQASMEKLIANKQLPSNLAGLSSTLYTQDSSLNYTHGFEQIGNYSKYQFFLAYDDGTDNSWTTNHGSGASSALGDGEKGIKYTRSPIAHTGTILLQPKLGTPTMVSAFSDIRGWTLTNEALLTLQDVFMKEPFVVPAQSIDYRSFETVPSSSGFGTTACPLPLVQCESICILHPRHENDRTVFRQIQSNGYQISVNGVKFPWQIVDTLEPEFYQHQLDNSDFDGMFPARDDWENSITTPITATGVRLSGRNIATATATTKKQTVSFTTSNVECMNEPSSDNTDFMPTITLQRPTAGASLAFEGITNRYATVMITGQASTSSVESLNGTARATDKNPYFCNVAYDIYGNIKDANTAESASTGILKYGQATPKCVPVRQCCMLFSILPERGNAKNFQFLKNDPFYIGYLDRSRDAVSY